VGKRVFSDRGGSYILRWGGGGKKKEPVFIKKRHDFLLGMLVGGERIKKKRGREGPLLEGKFFERKGKKTWAGR